MSRTASLGIRLLSDLRDIFTDAGMPDAIHTADLLEQLHAIPEAPWADLYGKPLNDRGLANRLGRYQIEPKQVRVGDRSRKGYTRESLWDAWQRYLDRGVAGRETSETSDTEARQQTAADSAVSLVSPARAPVSGGTSGAPDPDYCVKCGLDYLPGGTCRRCDARTT